MPIPKSKSSKLDGTPHYKRPDNDNLQKMYLDCLQMAGNILTDDSIVSEIHAYKVYSKNPRTEIVIEPIRD